MPCRAITRRIIGILDVRIDGAPPEVGAQFQKDLDAQVDTKHYFLAPRARMHELMAQLDALDRRLRRRPVPAGAAQARPAPTSSCSSRSPVRARASAGSSRSSAPTPATCCRKVRTLRRLHRQRSAHSATRAALDLLSDDPRTLPDEHPKVPPASADPSRSRPRSRRSPRAHRTGLGHARQRARRRGRGHGDLLRRSRHERGARRSRAAAPGSSSAASSRSRSDARGSLRGTVRPMSGSMSRCLFSWRRAAGRTRRPRRCSSCRRARHDYYALPFPNDLHRKADGTLDLTNFPTNSLIVDQYRMVAETLDGFALNAAMSSRFSDRSIRRRCPTCPARSADGASVYLVNIDAQFAAHRERTPIIVDFRTDQTQTIRATGSSCGHTPASGSTTARSTRS